MGKGNHFSGQPLYSQVIYLLNKSKILHVSHENGGERYTKHFNCRIHLVVMLYAVIMRFDSLREITASLLAETHKPAHLGITFKIGHSKHIGDVNKRRPKAIYRDLYATYRPELSSDSRSRKTHKWMKRLPKNENPPRQGIRCPVRALTLRLGGLEIKQTDSTTVNTIAELYCLSLVNFYRTAIVIFHHYFGPGGWL